MIEISQLVSMAGFAIAASISPGPVNVVALSSGLRHGLKSSMAHVSGATVGFTILLVTVGLGLDSLVQKFPELLRITKWAGMLFLLYMAVKLAADSGDVGDASNHKPSFWDGALMQWLNPKAWLASIAGMAAFAAGGAPYQVWFFAGVYFIICYVSIACWAAAGAALRGQIRDARHIRMLNRCLALTLVASVIYLFYASSP